MKKIVAWMLALIVALSMAPVVADEASDWAYIQEKGTLVIGITEYAPMNYYDDDGELIGFDTEFAKAVCEKLDIEAEFVVIEWSSKELELNSRTIDCIWNGLTVDEERKQNMSFSQSYMKNKQVIVMKASAAEKYAALKDMTGLSLVAEEGSAGEKAVFADEYLSQADYTPVGTMAMALMEVRAGTADAAVVDFVMASAMVGAGTDYANLAILPDIELAAEEYAIGLRLGSDAAEPINAAIDALNEAGTLLTLAEKYGQAAALLSNQA